MARRFSKRQRDRSVFLSLKRASAIIFTLQCAKRRSIYLSKYIQMRAAMSGVDIEEFAFGTTPCGGAASQFHKLTKCKCDVVHARDDHTADLLSRTLALIIAPITPTDHSFSRTIAFFFNEIARTSWWVLLLLLCASWAALKLFGCARMVGILRLLINLKDHEITQNFPSARYRASGPVYCGEQTGRWHFFANYSTLQKCLCKLLFTRGYWFKSVYSNYFKKMRHWGEFI